MRRLAFWALVLTVFLLALSSGAPLLYQLLYALIALPVIGYAMALLGVRRLEGRVRRLTPYLQVGEPVEQEITFQNNAWWPRVLLEVEHHTNPPETGGWVVSLWPYRATTWQSHSLSQRRGVYTYGKLTVISRDPLGLFSRRITIGDEQSVLVYPATVDIPAFHVPSGQSWGEGMAAGRNNLPSSIVSGVRDYVTGDSFRRVHWRSTARRAKLMVKEFEPEPAGPSHEVWVFLDLWEGVQAGEGTESTIEYGVTIAASVAKRYLEMGRSVGLYSWGEKRELIQPRPGAAQFGRIMEKLAVVQAGGEGPMSDAMAEATDQALPGSSAVLISSANPTDISSAARILANHRIVVVPVYLDAASFGGRPSANDALTELTALGIESYVIHRGDEIERTLDSRTRRPMASLPQLSWVNK